MIHDRVILLVEDDAKDEALTLRALKKSNVVNPVVVARDGVEALDYLFHRGAHHSSGPQTAEARRSRGTQGSADSVRSEAVAL